MAKKNTAPKRTTRRWLERHAQQQMWLYLGGSALTLLGAILANLFTHWAFWYLLGWKLRRLLGLAPATADTWAWIGVALLYPLYFLTSKEELQKAELDFPGQRLTGLVLARSTGMWWLPVFAGPKTLFTFARMIAQFLLIAPAMTWTAIGLARRAWQWKHLDIAGVSPLLHELLKADGRVPIAVLLAGVLDSPPRAQRLFSDLTLLDDVLPLKEGEPALLLGSDLRHAIRDWKRRPEKEIGRAVQWSDDNSPL